MTDFVIQDGYRRITFDGDLIGRGSSKRHGHWRWTDMNLYRTAEGSYILEKIGVSRVTHVQGCPRIAPDLPRFQEMFPGRDPDDAEFSYDDCVPDIYDFPSLLIERDRVWVQISDDPESVIRALMRYRGTSRWLPRSCVQLLDQAADVDPAVRLAYTNVEQRIA